MKVIDSSSLIKYFSREPGWRRVRQLILEGVVTLDLAVKEVANALWKKILRDEIDLNIARKIVGDLARGEAIKMFDQRTLIPEALELAVRNKVTIYDALFIVLAKKLKIALITSDKRQAEIAEKEGVNVIRV